MHVDQFPSFLQSTFRPQRRWFSRTGFDHFRFLIIALLINARATKLSHLANAIPQHGHRTSHARFLISDWDAPSILSAQAERIIRQMKPGKREAIYLLIDDTRIKKRGKKMYGLSKIWDPKIHSFMRGHVVITAAILFRGVTIPWAIELWIPKAQAGAGYRKLTEIAVSMIKRFPKLMEMKVRVLFDAAYLAVHVTKACESRGFTWFSVAARNRNLFRRGKKKKIKQLAPGVLRYHGHRIRVKRSRGWRWMRIASVVGALGRTGEVRLVCSKRSGPSSKELLSVVTNELNMKPREIIATYEKRWNIEVLFKELRNSLGLGEYQVLSRTAIERHLHLSCMAHQTLTHQAVMEEGAQAKQEYKDVILPTLNQQIQSFRDRVNRDRTNRLLNRIKDKKLKTKLRSYLLKEAAVAA